MTPSLLKLAVLLLLPVNILSSISCSLSKGSRDVTPVEAPDGAIAVDTFTMIATVTGIEADRRKVTLVTPQGRMITCQASHEVANFAEFKIGDQVKAVVTEEVVIAVGSAAMASGVPDARVAVAPVGAKPGGVMVDTIRITARVHGLNANFRRITLQFPGGSTRTLKVGERVNLSAVHPGEDLTVLWSQGLAITLTKL